MASRVFQLSGSLLRPANAIPQICQTRNTFILKRRWPPGLIKKGKTRAVLRAQNFVYDLVEDTNLRKKENVDVILTSYVEGLGERGDKVSLKPNYAYNKLLLPGLAVYASPENLQKFEEEKAQYPDQTMKKTYSSITAQRTLEVLSRFVLRVVMNKDTEWTLEPWHIRMSFRKCCIFVPDYAIEMPKFTIKGPNLDLEGKYFTVTVTVNKTEQVQVKCSIRHWSTEETDRLPYVEKFWELPMEPLFPEVEVTST